MTPTPVLKKCRRRRKGACHPVVITLLAGAALGGCYHQRPELTPLDQSLDAMHNNPVLPQTAMTAQPEPRENGSLWRPGAKQFFRDQRAHEVGDILTVVVNENAEAETEANTETSRTHTGTSGVNGLLNLGNKLVSRGIPLSPTGLVDTESARDFDGEAKTDRKDTLNARIAATVTQVLPNGNLVIQGRREVVVNYELQELVLQGIVRPQDISRENTIDSHKIAEARISYAGRGIVDQQQTPQPGVRFLDKWLPF